MTHDIAREIEKDCYGKESDAAGLSELHELLCGCGKKARYEVFNGMACNKHMRCMTYEEQADLVARLTDAMIRTDATIEHLREIRKVDPELLRKHFDI